MKDFINSFVCISRMHCKTCREKASGVFWRRSLRKVYKLPGDIVDFECPYGYTVDNLPSEDEIAKANNRPVVKKPILNDKIEARLTEITAICEGCDMEYCAWRNRTACAKRRILSEKNPQMITTACKRNKWGIDDLK